MYRLWRYQVPARGRLSQVTQAVHSIKIVVQSLKWWFHLPVAI